ncbi:hypothetical protein SRIMHP_32815 [Streptomyces rimosus subsp. rimosus]|uniref:Uncharacterized protein n=1 Tax=Streptomyces rimosus subsp. rimosus TaxID=132474 RepID=A0ABY3ZG81_STRRM|nr:hypothetical protein SRIMR7_35450 [Streptomyces rimosus subsp. rimosus]UTH98917.1 hypothetical protein SRIMHP_32815 [Streptomyces rimosus subsp. rimosus]UTJ17016.1 hypothetical protein SRIMDV3_32715 [Streptomyces rimosus subsp. rimosus]
MAKNLAVIPRPGAAHIRSRVCGPRHLHRRTG